MNFLRCSNASWCRVASARKAIQLRSLSQLASSFESHVSKPSSRFQIYISQTTNPFVNLSIEHFLLEKSHPDSTIFFLYTDRPCVVIGRNQNPWLETNLKALAQPISVSAWDPSTGLERRSTFATSIDLVRRRSGGGTVFHDYGNINYSVICPPADFTRDKHAEMVVRALRKDNPRARVNVRHDIVLDQGLLLPEANHPDPEDAHATAYEQKDGEQPFLKVSGSAYKLTRLRTLHHGTCLINSPNVGGISSLLRSPARDFTKARGVDSVRSPVGNVYHEEDKDAMIRFQENVLDAFSKLHGLKQPLLDMLVEAQKGAKLLEGDGILCGYLNDDLAEIPRLQKGITELKSPQWIYEQTPQFIFSSHPTEDDDRARPPLPRGLPQSTRVWIQSRSGVVDAVKISVSDRSETAAAEATEFARMLTGVKLHETLDMNAIFQKDQSLWRMRETEVLGNWLNDMFATPASRGMA